MVEMEYTSPTAELTKEQEIKMLQQIWDEIRSVRDKLDHHAERNDSEFSQLKKDIHNLSKDLTGHKVKLAGVIALITLIATSFAAWVTKHITTTGA